MITDIDPRVIQRLADMHAVYRMFDRAGKLLYVGKTGHVARFDNHATKRWFPLVASITLEWHDTEASAALAEKRAIEAERPRYNIAGNTKRRRLTAPVPQPKMPEQTPERDILADVLAVFGTDNGLHWEVLAGRLAARFPDRWARATKQGISAECRALGVPSVCVRYPSGPGSEKVARILQGCRLKDVISADARQLTSA